ncbi:nucleotidyltransferase domain-containing protein [Desulfopila inferna]|uniref:nucleotidyltransferase domain-containing protein n=1 Tax=Desulfopila inferna TaxID=468528 RepID=UPI00196292EC|nr:nucleotidyltransferase family protein [Desulfopila inferna]MBM9605797.1 nucleotidyltransferase family protein [Desulfopila inferna]
MRNEDALILHLTCKALDLPAYQSLKISENEDFDWEYFAKASVIHGVFLLIYPILKLTRLITIPENQKVVLKTLARNYTIKSIRLSAELVKICTLLKGKGIPAVPFKGPTLSHAVYDKQDVRIFSDLDVLLKANDVENALVCLQEQGYAPLINLDQEQLTRYKSFENDIQLSNLNGVVVEIHWEATGRYLEKAFDFEYFGSRVHNMDFFETKIQQLAREDLLIYLCVHGTRHAWERLEWLCSVACILRNPDIVDFTEIFSRVKSLGCRRIVLQAFILAQEVFAIDLPKILQERIMREQKTLDIVGKNKKDLSPVYNDGLNTIQKSGHRFKLFQFLLRDHWTGSVKYLFRQVFRPRVTDFQLICLPAKLFPLYYLIRPYRLVLKGLINLKR